MINHPLMEKIAEKAGTSDGDSYDFQFEVIAALEAAEAENATLAQECKALRAANESVAVCAKHVTDITSGDCAICEIEALRARVAELEGMVHKKEGK